MAQHKNKAHLQGSSHCNLWLLLRQTKHKRTWNS